MADIAFIAQAFTSLQATANIAKALIGVRDQAMIDAKLIELNQSLITAQGNVMQAQSEQSALIQEVCDLKQKIMDMENWRNEQQRYQLISPWAGGFVYALKESCKGADPPHWICQQCYEKGRKSVLQNCQKHDRRIFYTLKCFNCNFEVERHESPAEYI